MKENDVLGFSSTENKEIYMIGVSFGFNSPTDLESKDGFFRVSTLKTYDKAVLTSLILWKSRNNDEIDNNADIEKALEFSEKCAESGLKKLFGMVHATSKETLTKKLMLDLDLVYEKNVVNFI